MRLDWVRPQPAQVKRKINKKQNNNNSIQQNSKADQSVKANAGGGKDFEKSVADATKNKDAVRSPTSNHQDK